MKSIDYTESNSLSPTIKRKNINTLNQIITKEYNTEDKSFFVKRFAIDTNNLHHLVQTQTPIVKGEFRKIEKELFEFALKELDNTNIVLADVFVPELVKSTKDKFIIKKDLKSGGPEIHTVCLWKKSSDQIVIFDPSNSTLTDYIDKPLANLSDKTITIQRYGNFNERSKITDDKFYSTSMIATPGLDELDSRDCIDIAVKIALVLNEVVKSYSYISIQKSIAAITSENNDYKTLGKNNEILESLNKSLDLLVINEIKSLSNQASNNSFISNPNNGTLVRGLQSSDIKVRETVLKLLKDNKGSDLKTKEPADLIIVNTLEELKKLDGLRTDPNSAFHKNLSAINLVGKIFLNKIDKVDKLQKDIEQFKGNFQEIHKIFPELKYFPNLKLEIKVVKDSATNVDLNRLIDYNNGNKTALHLATLNNDFIEINNLLSQFTNSDDTKKYAGIADINGYTALHLAAYNKDLAIFKKLIEAMEPVDIAKAATGDQNYTVLHKAVHSNNSEMVRLLIEKNITGLVETVDIYGQTALHWAASNGNNEIAEQLINEMKNEDLLIQQVSGYTVLHFAVHSNDLELIKLLINRNVPGLVEKIDMYSQTALFWAVHKGNNKIIAQLINAMKDDDFFIKKTLGYTVLHSAVQSNNVKIVKLLVDKNIPGLVEAVDIYGQTALHWAATKGSDEITKLLLSVMEIEDIFKKSKNGYTALDWAKGKVSEEVIDLFNIKKSIYDTPSNQESISDGIIGEGDSHERVITGADKVTEEGEAI